MRASGKGGSEGALEAVGHALVPFMLCVTVPTWESGCMPHRIATPTRPARLATYPWFRMESVRPAAIKQGSNRGVTLGNGAG